MLDRRNFNQSQISLEYNNGLDSYRSFDEGITNTEWLISMSLVGYFTIIYE